MIHTPTVSAAVQTLGGWGTAVGLVISALALTVAVVGIVLSAKANRTAKRSAALSTERHDVYWEGDWAGYGRYVLRKRGRDVARNVRATIEVDEESVTNERAEMRADGAELVFEFPGAKAERLREQKKEAEARARASHSSFGYPGPMNLDAFSHRYSERVDWQTPLGVHKIHEASGMTGLGDDEG